MQDSLSARLFCGAGGPRFKIWTSIARAQAMHERLRMEQR
jgi:hypothetical protein